MPKWMKCPLFIPYSNPLYIDRFKLQIRRGNLIFGSLKFDSVVAKFPFKLSILISIMALLSALAFQP